MTQIILRLPSKVPYGYVEVSADSADIEDIPSPETLATFYATYMKAYKEAEEKALTFQPPILKAKPAVSKSVDDVLSEDEVKDLLVKELGAVPVPNETGDEPWNQETEAEEKPWVAKAKESDWDFG